MLVLQAAHSGGTVVHRGPLSPAMMALGQTQIQRCPTASVSLMAALDGDDGRLSVTDESTSPT